MSRDMRPCRIPRKEDDLTVVQRLTVVGYDSRDRKVWPRARLIQAEAMAATATAIIIPRIEYRSRAEPDRANMTLHSCEKRNLFRHLASEPPLWS